MLKEPDLKKYAQEVNEMQMLPAASVELPSLAALAIISHIQLATRHPAVADSEFTKIAIDVAKQLQNLFNQDSETYKVLELGWNPEADILAPSGELENECSSESARDRDPQLLKAIKNYFAKEGIDLDEDLLAPSEEQPVDNVCDEPCDKFLQNLGCRCTGYKIAEVVSGDDISSQTLAASAAITHQLEQSLESEGFEFLDM